MQKAQQDGALFDPAKRERLNEAAEFPRALELLKQECQNDTMISCYLAGQLCYMGLGGYLTSFALYLRSKKAASVV